MRTFGEAVAFSSAPKHSVVAIGCYGCIRGKENKKYFIDGFLAMVDELEPEAVIIYGTRATFSVEKRWAGAPLSNLKLPIWAFFLAKKYWSRLGLQFWIYRDGGAMLVFISRMI